MACKMQYIYESGGDRRGGCRSRKAPTSGTRIDNTIGSDDRSLLVRSGVLREPELVSRHRSNIARLLPSELFRIITARLCLAPHVAEGVTYQARMSPVLT